jgi:hypothetical protein
VATVSRRSIGFLSGNPQANQITFVVASFTDAAITVAAYSDAARTALVTSKTINASAGADPKLAKYADDRGSNDPAGVTYLCWVGSSTLTGLAANTRYYLTLTQGATVESDPTTCTAPASGTDFQVWLVGCDKSYADPALPDTWPGPGIWRAIYDLSPLSKLSYMVFSDDLGYADYEGQPSWIINDSVTGKSATDRASTSGLAYDYGLTYLALLGMLGDTAISSVTWGRDEYRNWCVRNMPWAVQWGDHEFTNQIGQLGSAATASSTWAGGKAAWDGLFDPLRPTPDIRSADTTARHWGMTLGDLRILNMDCITRASGASNSFPHAYPYGFTALLGTNQITDLLNAADVSTPFKILISPYLGERTWIDTPGNLYPQWNFSQSPHSLVQATEWERLYFAGTSPSALMVNDRTNGETGVLIKAHSDLHNPHVERHYGYATGATGTGLRANWMSYYFANATQPNQKITAAALANVQDKWHDGKEAVWVQPEWELSVAGTPTYYHGAACFEVDGSIPEVTGTLWITTKGAESTYDAAYTGAFRVGSNRPLNQMFSDWEVHAMTYSEFRTLVEGYLHRTDITTANVVNFIEFGRIRLFDDLRVAEMETTATVTITSDEGSLSADLVEIRSVQDGDGLELERVGLLELIPGVNTYQYSVRGHTIIAPGQSSLSIAYFARPTTLVGAADGATRTLLDAYPSLWLQAALVEGFRFTQDYAAESNVAQNLAREIEKANNANTGGRMGVKPTQKDPRRVVTAGGSGL